MEFLKNIIDAYCAGREFAEVAENRAWLGKKHFDNETEYYNARDRWYTKMQQLNQKKVTLSFLEKIAFTIGDEIKTQSTPYPLQVAYPDRN